MEPEALAVKTEPELSMRFEDGGPGAYLRRAREEANVSVEKIAASLLLNPQTVEALEADSFDRLPAPTFVRGYLRGYARVLGLPSGPILEMYDRQGFEPPPLASDTSEEQQADTSDTAVRLVTYAVGAVLVILVALWWQSQEDGGFRIGGGLFDWSSEPAPDPALANAEAPGTAPFDGEADGEFTAMATDRPDHLPPAGDAAPHDTSTDGQSTAMAAGQSDESPPVEEPMVPPPAGDAAPGDIATDGASTAMATDRSDESSQIGESVIAPPTDIASVEPVPASRSEVDTGAVPDDGVDPSPGAESDGADPRDVPGPAGVDLADATSESGSQAPGAVASASTPPASPSPTAGTSPDPGVGQAVISPAAQPGLVLEFVNESWVEVYDGERTRLFFGLVQPGRVLDFDGTQPFDVLLGFGKDVRVTIDGEAFDHTPYMKHGVARFSVGAGPARDDDMAESTDTAAPPDDTAAPPDDTAAPPDDTAAPPDTAAQEDTDLPAGTSSAPSRR